MRSALQAQQQSHVKVLQMAIKWEQVRAAWYTRTNEWQQVERLERAAPRSRLAQAQRDAAAFAEYCPARPVTGHRPTPRRRKPARQSGRPAAAARERRAFALPGVLSPRPNGWRINAAGSSSKADTGIHRTNTRFPVIRFSRSIAPAVVSTIQTTKKKH